MPNLGERPFYKYYPAEVSPIIDIPPISVAEMFRRTADKHPDDKVAVFLDATMTYGQLERHVDGLATALESLGLKKGDVVALLLPNSFQYPICFYGCLALGLTVTAINPTYKSLEIKHQLNDSGAKAIIALDGVFAEADKVLADTGIKHVIGTNIVDFVGLSPIKKFLGKLLKKIPTGKMPDGSLKLTDLCATQPSPPAVEIDPAQDVAVLQYTGGTTGTPKGAMLTHQNLVANALQCDAWLWKGGYGYGIVGVLPFFHSYAMTTCLNTSVAIGGFMILFPKPPDKMAELYAAIERWGQGTKLIFPGVAILFNKINQDPEVNKFDLGALEMAISGAGPLPQEIQLKFEKITGAKLVEGYGLTEASPVTHANPLFGRRVIGTIGLPFPNTDCKIMDMDTGDTELGLGPDNVGELCVKGPQVMKGYLNRPEETAACLRDGWLYTGDIAYMDEDGYTHIMDRAKDMIKYKGWAVFPAEIEDYMHNHPAVSEVAIVGLPHPEFGEIIKAHVVLKPDHQGRIDEEGLQKWCRENLTHYKVPQVIAFREELPKTMVGKVLRRMLKQEDLAKGV
ncbi:MAG: long-chain fatty acid--CoA ligase [Proteobacteria bacterium]|nr:long-chain fatty acid--CoA ligase [Pseudomonadota bacterium]MBU1742670.1 long-chain fatty acid--CoA ligase [Pseudomonadota bacterium]